MAPVTRARRRKDSIPLVLVLSDPRGSRPAPELPLLQPEDTITPAATPSKPAKKKPATEGTDKLANGTVDQPPPPPEDNPTDPAAADSKSDSGDDDDDEAPEAVSLDTGREAARKAQDKAKRAAEAQAEAARKKRKARDAKLKGQKEEANERKRKRRKANPEGEEEEVVDNSKALTIAEKSAEPSVDEANVTNPSPLSPLPAEEQLRKPTPPTLLPETLLAQVAAAKRRRHREQPDSHPKPEHEPEQKKQVIGTGIVGRNAEQNRRNKQRQKLNRTLKKGPVSVKVLKDDTKSRKILPPPAAKVVGSIKDSWLFGRKTGGAVRRDVVTGFVRK
ncbi:unnamed protein product [Tuber aestivum]|uniref:Uncharacterized protein n=1 Tax=Tuber aestivum TaxID=59557 RepID=A0A292PQM8_9PEZI|nr:unnamed protein product [Tuber aestivum]